MTINYPTRARQCVRNVLATYGHNFKLDELYVVWFSKTLENWKALVSTDRISGLYFEVTHNGAKNETYVDEYRKFANTTFGGTK